MKIAIQGHPTRGKEVIQILESLGGRNAHKLCGNAIGYIYHYHIDNTGNIIALSLKHDLHNYKFYTLEEFEKEFPFKIGDMVVTATERRPRQIIALEYYNGKLCYTLEDGFHYRPQLLELYKEMKEERNITLTLDKAKEWYKKDGELKEIALQAFTEKELNPLPKSWEEFCEKYPVKNGECWVGSQDIIYSATFTQDRKYKTWIPSRRSVKAHLAMIQLEQLRNCWWNGWEPEWNNSEKHVIKWEKDSLIVFTARRVHAFLVFPTREMAEEFLECFEDLIEKAGDLI
jgi:hypothetical protein